MDILGRRGIYINAKFHFQVHWLPPPLPLLVGNISSGRGAGGCKLLLESLIQTPPSMTLGNWIGAPRPCHGYLERGALGANARLQFLNECVLLLGKTNRQSVTLKNLKTLISFRVIVNLDLRFISACSHSAMRALNACWEVLRSLMGLSSPP